MTDRPPRILIVGAGVAGSLIASGLRARDDVEVICLDKAASANHSDSGTGLNIGPNGIKALQSAMPEVADAIVANAYPWRRWTIGLTNGRELFDLDLLDVADNPGVRIRWSELYTLLRAPLGPAVTYSAELSGCGRDERGLFATYTDASGAARTVDGIDLLISADGRYSHCASISLAKTSRASSAFAFIAFSFPSTTIVLSTTMANGSMGPIGSWRSACRATSSTARAHSPCQPMALFATR